MRLGPKLKIGEKNSCGHFDNKDILKLNTAAGGELTDAPEDARDERDEGEPTRQTPCVHPQADRTDQNSSFPLFFLAQSLHTNRSSLTRRGC